MRALSWHSGECAGLTGKRGVADGTAEYAEFEEQEAVFSRPHYVSEDMKLTQLADTDLLEPLQYAPVQLSERIDHWVLGTLERAGLTADVVHFSSCLWDGGSMLQ